MLCIRIEVHCWELDFCNLKKNLFPVAGLAGGGDSSSLVSVVYPCQVKAAYLYH